MRIQQINKSKHQEPPEAIMINVPEAFFEHNGKGVYGPIKREAMFRSFYEQMGVDAIAEDDCFYHFIGSIPIYKPTHAFVCFKGHVQYKAIIVDFLKKQPVMLENYQHPEPRNWIVTTGPVLKAPEGMVQRGFRNFRYCKMLF